jgi:short-subunit dehydrogenase involved in D-alanine esterification of teichoic acids
MDWIIDMQLKGKNVVVTGGDKGIGRAISLLVTDTLSVTIKETKNVTGKVSVTNREKICL